MKNRKTTVLRVFGSGLAICLLIQPLHVSASNLLLAKSVMKEAGIASIMDVKLSESEYIEKAKEAEGASWGYTNIGIANVENGNLNIRSEASTGAKLVGKLPKSAACEIIEIVEDGAWAHIISGEVEGYVSTEFLLTGPDAKLVANSLVKPMVLIETDALKVRDGASLDSAVLTQVPEGEELEYLETLDGWYKVAIDGDIGYVSSDYSSFVEKLSTAITMTELLYGQGVSNIRVDLVEYAKQFVGNPYVYGGTSLTKGADCSGFVQSVFKNFGIKLSRSSGSQAGDGTKISTSDLLPGDLIFYANSSGTINHVALYIGGGQVVHASNPSTGIRISKYNYRSPVKCVRVLND